MKRTVKHKATMTATAETRTGYGAATIQWAETMLAQGIAPAEVARRTGINSGYVRTIKFRLNSKENDVLPQPSREHDSEIIREFAALASVSQDETTVATVSETHKNPRFKITRLDVVFYATTLATCAGLVTLLQWWGLPVSLVYSLILVDAMETAKDSRLKESAQSGAVAVLIFEMIAACVHTYLFNKVLWANYKSLPFRIGDKFIETTGKWIVENEDKPFIIAVGIALVLSGSAVYSIHKSIVTANELAKNKKI